MKKSWKIFWIVCAVIAAIGFGCCIASLALGFTVESFEKRFPNGINIGKIGIVIGENGVSSLKPKEIRGTYRDVNKLSIDMGAGEVRILQSDGDDIVVETQGIRKKLNFQCEVEDKGELKLASDKKLEGVVNQNLGTVYVYIPENMVLEKVDLDIGIGTLIVDDICADEFTVDVGAGEATVNAFEAKTAELNCGAGEITAWGIVEKEIIIDCGMGSICYYTEDSENEYNYDITCGIGEVTCGANTYSGIGCEPSHHNHGKKEMNIDCGVGEVRVSFENKH